MQKTALTLALMATLSLPAHAELQARYLDGSSTANAYYDTNLNITWLADLNYIRDSGYSNSVITTWSVANSWVDQLVVGGVNGWRLPRTTPLNSSSFNYNFTFDGTSDRGYNVSGTNSELGYLYYVTLSNLSRYTSTSTLANLSETGCYSSGSIPGTCLDNPGPFTYNNLQGGGIWSGTVDPANAGNAWFFDLSVGFQGSRDQTLPAFVWAVHDGDVATPIPEPETYALVLAGLAVVWRATRRKKHV